MTLIDGEPAELVDTHWLFAAPSRRRRAPGRAAGLPPAERRSVDAEHAAPDGRGAGYRVVGDERRASSADLVIASPRPTSRTRSGRAGRSALRSDPGCGATDEDSIYRYDRAGLLMALKAAGAGRGR